MNENAPTHVKNVPVTLDAGELRCEANASRRERRTSPARARPSACSPS